MAPLPTSRAGVERLRFLQTNVFTQMSELAQAHQAINLGQGFPDWDGPAEMLRVAQAQIAGGLNQYPPSRGRAELRQAIAADRLKRCGQEFDPESEVLVTFGATEAITATLLALVEPGSDVILIEPYYDAYAAAVAMAGAKRVSVPLVRAGDGFVLDTESLRRAVTTNTALIVVNTPHNPTGTVLSADDLAAIAEVAVEHDLVVLADEVYEQLTYDKPHLAVATVAGLADRTVTVSSAAKTFNVTGWKVGWALGPSRLIQAIATAKQFLTFAGGAPFQPAIAYALEHEAEWVAALRSDLMAKRDQLSVALAAAGWNPIRSPATYFVCADVGEDAWQFCLDLPRNRGVAAIPVTAFADHLAPWRSLVRFAFCKSDSVLAEGISRLEGQS